MAVYFLSNLAAQVKARSWKLSTNLVVDPTCYGPKQRNHAKKRIRSTCEKAQTEEFRGLIIDQCIVVQHGVHRENNMTDEEILTMRTLCLDFAEEEKEDFDDYVHRMTSVYLIWATESSPWGSACACPWYALYRACKHVICRAWELNLIPKEIS